MIFLLFGKNAKVYPVRDDAADDTNIQKIIVRVAAEEEIKASRKMEKLFGGSIENDKVKGKGRLTSPDVGKVEKDIVHVIARGGGVVDKVSLSWFASVTDARVANGYSKEAASPLKADEIKDSMRKETAASIASMIKLSQGAGGVPC